MKQSIVAMFGWIMPEPLAMTPKRTFLPPTSISSAADFGCVSVVMMAWLAALLPSADRSRTLISESGVFTREDAEKLRDAGCDGILVGEGLVRAEDIAAQTRAFAGVGKEQEATA